MKAPKSWKLLAVIMITQRPRITFFSISVQQVQSGHINTGLPTALTTVSDMRDRGSGNNHFAQLEHWRHRLWQPLNLSLLFIRSSSSAGAHQSAKMTHTGAELDTQTRTFSHTHTPEPRAIKSLLEPVLSDSSYQRAVKWKLDWMDDMVPHYPRHVL